MFMILENPAAHLTMKKDKQEEPTELLFNKYK